MCKPPSRRPRRRLQGRSRSSLLRREHPKSSSRSTDWSSGVAAVYDGDDWQESVADFFIGLFRCKPCRSSAEPAEGKNPFEEESKEDIF